MLQEDQHKGLLRGLFWAIPFWAIVMAANIDLSDQEAYFWTLARNLDGIHYEHPPLPIWLTAFFTGIFGDSAWAVRAPSMLFRTGALGLFAIWASDRWSRTVAKRGLWILLGSFMSIAGAVFALPDAYFCFFAVWTMMAADRRGSKSTGLALGLAFLSRWCAVALVPGVVCAFLTRRRGGPRWRGLAGALAIAALLQVPRFLSGGATFFETPHPPVGALAALANVITFLGAQLLYGGLTFAGALLIVGWILFRRGLSSPILGYNRSDSVRVPIMWWVAPFGLMFAVLAVFGEYRYYLTAFALFPLGAGIASALNFRSRDEETRFEWKMLLLSLSTMTIVSMTLVYPVGAWLRPYIENFRAYDLRMSPRGDLMGWKDWAAKDLTPAGLVGERVGYVAADYRLASQVAWAMNLKLPHYGTIGPQHHYKFWPSPLTETYDAYVLFTDNRHGHTSELEKLCAHAVSWNTRTIALKGQVVKHIEWATCHRLK